MLEVGIINPQEILQEDLRGQGSIASVDSSLVEANGNPAGQDVDTTAPSVLPTSRSQSTIVYKKFERILNVDMVRVPTSN